LKRGIWLALILLFGLLFPSAGQAGGLSYGAWLPYWEIGAAMDEARQVSGRVDTFVAFACHFNSRDQVFVPPETHEILSGLDDPAFSDAEIYISIVNDVEVEYGKYELKSAALMKRLFMSHESQSRHIEQLISLIDKYSPDGLELDYENFRGDPDLWSSYVEMISKVWSICQREGIKLRVALESDAPKYATFPEGPEYSVMCYNLFGNHSGPGPKADYKFLEQVCKLYLNVPGRVRMAFSTGGFDWADGKTTALTQQQAIRQLDQAGVEPQRDPLSGAMKAAYSEDGVGHEVWYADGQTLAIWRDICLEYGYDSFDLFRLGGNDLDDLTDTLWSAQL